VFEIGFDFWFIFDFVSSHLRGLMVEVGDCKGLDASTKNNWNYSKHQKFKNDEVKIPESVCLGGGGGGIGVLRLSWDISSTWFDCFWLNALNLRSSRGEDSTKKLDSMKRGYKICI